MESFDQLGHTVRHAGQLPVVVDVDALSHRQIGRNAKANSVCLYVTLDERSTSELNEEMR